MKIATGYVVKLIKLGFLVAALITATGCVSDGPKSANAENPDAASQQHIKLALKYIGSDNRDLARVHLEKAAKYRSRSAQLYNAYALLYQSEQEFKLAEEYFTKALARNKSYTLSRYNFATFLYNQGRLAEARKQIKLVSEDLGYDRRAQAFYILGLTQNRMGDSQPALESFERAAQLSSGFPAPYIEAAELYYQLKNYPLCKMALDRFRQLSAPTAQSLWLAVRVEERFGNRDKAASAGLKLKNLFPYSQENLAYQAWLKQ
jgi:type IV pilus assembly protein PilF